MPKFVSSLKTQNLSITIWCDKDHDRRQQQECGKTVQERSGKASWKKTTLKEKGMNLEKQEKAILGNGGQPRE